MIALGRNPNMTLEVDRQNAILNLVNEGMGHAKLPSYTLSIYEDRASFIPRCIYSPRIMSALMVVRPSRRLCTETQKTAMHVVKSVLISVMQPCNYL